MNTQFQTFNLSDNEEGDFNFNSEEADSSLQPSSHVFPNDSVFEATINIESNNLEQEHKSSDHPHSLSHRQKAEMAKNSLEFLINNINPNTVEFRMISRELHQLFQTAKEITDKYDRSSSPVPHSPGHFADQTDIDETILLPDSLSIGYLSPKLNAETQTPPIHLVDDKPLIEYQDNEFSSKSEVLLFTPKNGKLDSQKDLDFSPISEKSHQSKIKSSPFDLSQNQKEQSSGVRMIKRNSKIPKKDIATSFTVKYH